MFVAGKLRTGLVDSGCFVGMFIKMVSFHVTAGIVWNELIEASSVLACSLCHSSICNSSSIMALVSEFLVVLSWFYLLL